MPLDDTRIEDTRSWLHRAIEDLRAGEIDLLASPPLTADAAFHAQQAAEKAMKAFLFWHDVPFRRTHNLTDLGRQCADVDSTLEPTLDRSSQLSDYAWRFRYPADTGDPAPSEARVALAQARQLFVAIQTRLPPETRP